MTKIPRHYWTPAEDAELRRLYPDHKTAAVAKIFGLQAHQVYQRAYSLALSKSAAYMASEMSGRIQRLRLQPSMMATQFKPGTVPWNKGMKGLQIGGVATRFQPGKKPHTWVPIGSYRMCDGMLQLKVTDLPGAPNLRWKNVARLVWENAHGPVPASHIVIFRPGMRTAVLDEITLDRLECISRAENARRNHARNKHPQLAGLVQLKGAITRQINRIAREQSTTTNGATAP